MGVRFGGSLFWVGFRVESIGDEVVVAGGANGSGNGGANGGGSSNGGSGGTSLKVVQQSGKG